MRYDDYGCLYKALYYAKPAKSSSTYRHALKKLTHSVFSLDFLEPLHDLLLKGDVVQVPILVEKKRLSQGPRTTEEVQALQSADQISGSTLVTLVVVWQRYLISVGIHPVFVGHCPGHRLDELVLVAHSLPVLLPTRRGVSVLRIHLEHYVAVHQTESTRVKRLLRGSGSISTACRNPRGQPPFRRRYLLHRCYSNGGVVPLRLLSHLDTPGSASHKRVD